MIVLIEFYFWLMLNGFKIIIVFEEMGLLYNVNLIDIGVGDQFKLEFFVLLLNNWMFVIIDLEGLDGQFILMFESGVIL